MTVELLNEILEEGFTQAFEVKDAKSVRRTVQILTENLAKKQAQEELTRQTESKFDKTLATMETARRDDMAKFDLQMAKYEAARQEDKVQFEQQMAEFRAERREDRTKFEAARQEDKAKFDSVLTEMRVRFEAVDNRFEDQNRRHTSTQWLIGVMFVVLGTLMTIYRYLTPPS